MRSLLTGACVAMLAPAARAAPSTVAWSGQPYTEVRALRALPELVQDVLLVGATGFAGIADRGAKFNATDVLTPGVPMRRFVVAGVRPDAALVAVEHGGRGFHVEVLLYAMTKGPVSVAQRWNLVKAPESLGELVTLIGEGPRRGAMTQKEADDIAKTYFRLHVGCGSYKGVTDGGDIWVVEGRWGFAATPIKGFTIDKKSGRITSPVGPSYADKEEMLRKTAR